jgi:hypothetical protein
VEFKKEGLFMKNYLSLFVLALSLSACAGVEADLEKARYLLGKGGEENGEKVIAMLEPLLGPTKTSAPMKFEVYRLYAGAQMQAGGYDPIGIVSALIYSDDGDLLNALKPSGELITDDAKERIDNAIAALDEIFADEDFATADVRTKDGLYSQKALAYFLDALRVYLKISGLSETSFSIADCETKFGASSAENRNRPQDAVDQMENSRSTYIADPAGARLSASNSIVEAIDSLITDTEGSIGTANEFCTKLEELAG